MAKCQYRVVVTASTIVELEEDEMFAIEQAAPSMDISGGNWNAELVGRVDDK